MNLHHLYEMAQFAPNDASSGTIPNDQPAWDLSPEYISFDDPGFAADQMELLTLIEALESLEPSFLPALANAAIIEAEKDAALLLASRKALALGDRAQMLFQNLLTYANCVASVNGRDARAKELKGSLSSLGARFEKSSAALELLLARVPDAFIVALLATEEGRPHAFRIAQSRKYRSRLLPLSEEKVLSSLAPDGHNAWGELYNAIAGTARCNLHLPSGETREIGLAEAASLWREPDRRIREAGYRAQAEAFSLHEESLAAILNAISGWRLAEGTLRSEIEPVHFLDPALAQNRISRATLESLLGAVEEERELGRKALRLQARLMGVERLDCWDILAPAPQLGLGEPRRYSFTEGLELVRQAYSAVHPAMGDFALSMRDARRIEARVLDAKRPGAYCTRFPKSRTPRVFQTYRGSLSDVFTLAHELGHAYHGWLLRELPLQETSYPMTLAETASTFAETALADFIANQCSSDEAGLLELAWSDAQDAATFLLNIPARFAFEKAFYERRAEKPLGPGALTELMAATWKSYYGDALGEYDGHFWKSKLHFYFTGTSFYNFPYTFGYLFSLGVYARREVLGADFHGAYCALLRDTGRMEAEELAHKHLGVDLTQPEFWRASLAILRKKVTRFETMVEGLQASR